MVAEEATNPDNPIVIAEPSFNQTYNLTRYLQDNERQLAVLGVVATLAIFAQTLQPWLFSYGLSSILLIATGVIYIEIRGQFPVPLCLNRVRDDWRQRVIFHFEHFWNRLGLFALLLDGAAALFAAYTSWTYPYAAAGFLIVAILMWSLPRILHYGKLWAAKIPPFKNFLTTHVSNSSLTALISSLLGAAISYIIFALSDDIAQWLNDLSKVHIEIGSIEEIGFTTSIISIAWVLGTIFDLVSRRLGKRPRVKYGPANSTSNVVHNNSGIDRTPEISPRRFVTEGTKGSNTRAVKYYLLKESEDGTHEVIPISPVEEDIEEPA